MPETRCRAADDGQRHGKAQLGGALDRLGGPAHGNPDRNRILKRAWINDTIFDRRPMLARPSDPLFFPEPQEQVELLGKQIVVIRKILTKEGERLGERPPPHHDLGPATRNLIQSGEVLEYTYRIV